MFGRKKRATEDDDEAEDVVDDDEDDDEAEDEDSEDEESEDDEPEDDEPEDDEPHDEWQALDEMRDWREDGPFDINEVDLDADDIQRLDFGALVVTPFDGMQLQMQVNQASGKVQSLLVVAQKSAIEIALFAAPLRSLMLAEVREEMRAATEEAGGTMRLVKGPLGTEVRRKLPAGDGGAAQSSRTWLVQGPRWLLRGVLMGPAGATNDVGKGEAQLLFEFFCNLVVRRGETPMVPGEVVTLKVPDSVATSAPGKANK